MSNPVKRGHAPPSGDTPGAHQTFTSIEIERKRQTSVTLQKEFTKVMRNSEQI